MLEDLDLSSIQDEGIRQCIVMLLNLVEDLKQENRALREENQRLRDEINRLKGEQGMTGESKDDDQRTDSRPKLSVVARRQVRQIGFPLTR